MQEIPQPEGQNFHTQQPDHQEPILESQTVIPWETRRDAIKGLLPAGVVPEVPATQWSPMVDEIDGLIASGELRQRPVTAERVVLVEGGRPVYDVGREAAAIEAITKDLPRIQLWNRVSGAEGVEAFDLAAPENEAARKVVIEGIRENGDVAVLPFAGERRTVRRNAEYALSIIGDPKRVIAVDAGYEEAATQEAKASGATVLDQRGLWREVVDWEKLQRNYGLPFSADAQPKGKSITMTPAYWYLRAHNLAHEGTRIFHADTDVIDPDPYIRYPDMPEDQFGGYDTLVNLAVPFVFSDEQNPVDHVVGGKQYRGNEGEKHEGDVAKQNRDRLIRRFGYMQGHFVQPVSDARAAILGNGRDRLGVGDGPWCCNMGIESLLNLNAIGQSIEQGEIRVAQTAFAGPKIENAVSPPWREAIITEHDADTIRWVLEHVRYLHGQQLADGLFAMYDALPEPVQENLVLMQRVAAVYPQAGFHLLPEVLPGIESQLDGRAREAFQTAVRQADAASLPHRWTPDMIRQFNERYGGMGFHHNLPGDTEAGQNRDSILYGEWLLPGPNQMIAEGLIDLDKVRAMYPLSR